MNTLTSAAASRRTFRLAQTGAAAVLASLALAALTPAVRAVDYYWDADADTSAAIGGTGPWDTTSLLWRLASPTGTLTTYPVAGPNNDAFLQGTAGTLTLSGGPIFVNDLDVAPTTGTAYTVAGATQTLVLRGAERSEIRFANNTSLTITAILGGSAGFSLPNAPLNGNATLVLDNAANSLTGGIVNVNRTLSTVGASATVALRNNALDLGSGSQFTHTGGAADVRLGEVSGAGTFNIGTNRAFVLALNNADFSGAITLGAAAGGLTVRGASVQTLSGTTTGLDGEITVGSRAGLTLAGTAAATAANVILTLRDRGTFTLDNNDTNNPNRFRDAGTVNGQGGTLVLAGNFDAGSTETMGAFTINSGQNVVRVDHNSATAATVLTFASFTRGATGTSVNFSGGNGSALVATGVGPRIAFTTTPGLTNGVIANGAGSGSLGFAIVNGTNFAGYSGTGAAGGVVAVTSTSVSGALATAATQNSNLTGNGTIAASGTVTYNTLKISPGASGQALTIGSGGTLATVGILLDGTSGNDFAINGGSIGGGATRHFHVWDPARTLSVSSLLGSVNQPLVKSGDGFLVLTGTTNQVAFGTSQAVNLAGGTLRADIEGAGLNFGTNNSLRLRGGVFEIAGGGTFTRAIGTNAGNVAFDDNGGFSAFGAEALVNIGGASIGLNWNAANFIQNGRALLFGSTQSNAIINFQNPVSLTGATTDYNAREVYVFDNVNSSADAARLSGALAGTGITDLLKTGPGTLQLTAANTFTGNTIVQTGTLQAGASGGTGAGALNVLGSTAKIIVNSETSLSAGDPPVTVVDSRATLLLGGDAAVTNRLNNNAEIVLDGGILNTGGLSERGGSGATVTPGVGALTLLTVDAILDLGAGASVFAFSDSSNQFWAGDLLIYNWTGSTAGDGTDQVYFGTNALGLTAAQLGQVRFFSDDGTTFLGTATFAPGLDGEIVPVPEPATVAAGLLALGTLGWTQRRRVRGGFLAARRRALSRAV